MVITLYSFKSYYLPPMLPNNLRALYNACFLRLFLAADIEPVVFNVLEAALIAVTHFFPVFDLPPRILRDLFLLKRLLHIVVIIYILNIKFIKLNI